MRPKDMFKKSICTIMQIVSVCLVLFTPLLCKKAGLSEVLITRDTLFAICVGGISFLVWYNIDTSTR